MEWAKELLVIMELIYHKEIDKVGFWGLKMHKKIVLVLEIHLED